MSLGLNELKDGKITWQLTLCCPAVTPPLPVGCTHWHLSDPVSQTAADLELPVTTVSGHQHYDNWCPHCDFQTEKNNWILNLNMKTYPKIYIKYNAVTVKAEHRSSRWCHDMETLSALLAICEGNPLFTSGFPSQGASRHWFFSFMLACTNSVIAGDLRCHDAM